MYLNRPYDIETFQELRYDITRSRPLSILPSTLEAWLLAHKLFTGDDESLVQCASQCLELLS